MSAPAFVQSPALSFRAFLAAGGRDPRHDPRPGDVVGARSPSQSREMRVEQATSTRVRGTARSTEGRCTRDTPFDVTLAAWRSTNASVSVFVVASE